MLTVSQAAAVLRSLDDVLILTHIRPDGDTVGCAAGLCAGLRALGKTACLLPNPDLTETYAPYFAPYAAPAGFTPKSVVSTDIASLGLLPENARPYADRIDLAIDHHPSFEGFGRHQLLRTEAAACGEILYDVLRELGPIGQEIALPLYVAVATDTGCFVYGNTTARTHQVAAALMETGIDCRPVNKALFRTKSRKRMQLESAMLSGCEFYDHDRVAVLSVPLSLMERFQASESDAEELSSLGGQIQGVDCAVTMKEMAGGRWKLSVRTGDRVDASAVCRLLGGGGHRAAAGCSVEGSYQEVRDRVLEAVARVAPERAG